MHKKLLKECPVCESTLKVKILQCSTCGTTIEGNFDPPKSKILYLGAKDLEFVELFIRVRGNIKEMEKALGVSYPTVRGMLNGIVQKMGYSVKKTLNHSKRMEIIGRLERSEITPEEAVDLLQTED